MIRLPQVFRVLFVVIVAIAILRGFVLFEWDYSGKWASNRLNIVRSESLQGLVTLLNENGPRIMAGNTTFDPNRHGEAFLSLISEWLIADPLVPLNTTRIPQALTSLDVDCTAKRYSGILSGEKLPSPRFIMDFVPFGYDLDALEIRFVETAPYVDLFVVYESPRTQSGWRKPLLLKEALSQSSRFRAFLPKMLYLSATDDDIHTLTEETLKAVHQKGLEKDTALPVHHRKGAWTLEHAMRSEMIKRFASHLKANATLRTLVGGDGGDTTHGARAWALQNDEDELVAAAVLAHMRHCHVQKEVSAIYFPCVSFKKNFHWLQQTSDLQCLSPEGAGASDSANIATAELVHYLWRPGPWAWPLSEMLVRSSTLRSVFPGRGRPECQHHMGVPSAVHLSSLDDPGMTWFKRFGVIEETPMGLLPSSLARDIAHGRVTAAALAATVQPWCNAKHPSVHTSTLSEATREVLAQLVPMVVRENPHRFPFHVPAFTGQNEGVHSFSDPVWTRLCQT